MDADHRPETDPSLLARHAVGDAAERAALLGRLRAQAVPVALHVPGASVRARLVGHGPGGLVLEPEPGTDSGALAAVCSAGRATAVARPEGVKLQFGLTGLAAEAGGALRAVPDGPLSRLQRRDAYRVVPPSEGAARLAIGGAARATVEVLDLSATGLSFVVAPDGLAVGDTIDGCRLELPARAPIGCALRVRAIERDAAGRARVGCEFASIEPSAARSVQVWIDDAQRVRRRRRPVLP